MSYYMGDYYMGDPGLFSFVKKAVRGVGRIAGGFLRGGPIGAVSTGVGMLTGAQRSAARRAQPQQRRLQAEYRRIQAHQVEVSPGYTRVGQMPGPELAPRRRRINPANPKALRRAIRRMDGFVGLARKSLKHTNYTLVTKSSRARKRRCS
jgi:hypothetical protein